MVRSVSIAALVVLAGALARDAAAETTIFVNANVVPMDVNRVLREYSVVVEGDTIAALGPAAKVEVPEGATVIDATGLWLIPGLADMHVHLFVDPNPDFMRLWLAEGVTTLRNLNTLPEHRTWAEEVLTGDRIGPTVYNTGPVIIGPPPEALALVSGFRAALIAGPLILFLIAIGILRVARGRWPGRGTVLGGGAVVLAVGLGLMVTRAIPLDALTSPFFRDSDVVESEAEAQRWVRRQADAGYRMVKIHEFMDGPVWLAAQVAAEEAGLYSISHLDPGVGLSDAVGSGMDEIAHVDELLDYLLSEEIDLADFRPVAVDMDRLQGVIETVAGHDLMVVSNMVTDENIFLYLEAGPSWFDRPEYAVVRPETLAAWREGRVVHWQGQQEFRRDLQPRFAALVAGLNAAGVPILAGTDVGVEGMVPSHIHREIELLARAGLSRFDALRAATANAGESLRRAGFEVEVGTVTPGARADLLLLRSDPLIWPGATRDRVGVMARGRWFSQAELDDLTAELLASD